MVINNTQQNLNFFYERPSDREMQVRKYKEAVAGTPIQRDKTTKDSKF